MTDKIIYFDNAASTKPCPEAVAAFTDCAENNYANPNALHGMGINAEKIINGAKNEILSKFSENGNLIFTSGATESNNLALFGVKKNKKIISTTTEHPSVSAVLDELERQGCEIVRLSPDKNNFEQKIADAVDENTVLVSAIAVNNETGFIIDTPKLYRSVKRKNPSCMVHIDAVQGFLKIPLLADYISISAHKIHGIKGIGGLFVKKSCTVKPLLLGGGQQTGLRSGTEAVELIAAFGAAVKAFKYDRQHYIGLCERLMRFSNSNERIKINSFNNLPNIINISVKGIKSEILLHFLAEKNIYVSSGSACARGKVSPVLEAFGLSRSEADSALRLSFSAENSGEDMEMFIAVLTEAIKRFG